MSQYKWNNIKGIGLGIVAFDGLNAICNAYCAFGYSQIWLSLYIKNKPN